MKNIATNTFGPAFKKLREKRGYSVKEACRDSKIMTPTALRKFENTDSSTSIENFNRLLIAIGATWEDFFTYYCGQTVYNHFHRYNNKLNEIINNGHYYKSSKIIKDLRQPVPDNPFLEALPGLLIQCVINTRHNSPITINKEEFQEVINYLQQVETWGQIEFMIFSHFLQIFTFNFVYYNLNKQLKLFKQNLSTYLPDKRKLLFIFLNTISYYSRNGYYDASNQLTTELENILNQDVCADFFHEKAILQANKGANLLRQNNPEGLVSATRFVKIMDLMINEFDTPQISGALQQYIDTIHSLNKTGIPFDPY